MHESTGLQQGSFETQQARPGDCGCRRCGSSRGDFKRPKSTKLKKSVLEKGLDACKESKPKAVRIKDPAARFGGRSAAARRPPDYSSGSSSQDAPATSDAGSDASVVPFPDDPPTCGGGGLGGSGAPEAPGGEGDPIVAPGDPVVAPGGPGVASGDPIVAPGGEDRIDDDDARLHDEERQRRLPAMRVGVTSCSLGEDLGLIKLQLYNGSMVAVCPLGGTELVDGIRVPKAHGPGICHLFRQQTKKPLGLLGAWLRCCHDFEDQKENAPPQCSR